jgi:tetratricopeptide (TPR) repeat protein
MEFCWEQLMRDHLKQIDDLLLVKNDIKKVEILISKLLRSELSTKDRLQILFRRARVRLLSGRPDNALDDLLSISEAIQNDSQYVAFLELLADCYFARFELASVGFTDRSDTMLAQQTYEEIIHRYPKYSNVGWIYYQLGRIWVTKNQMKEAVECFHQALLSPSHISFLTAYCYERLGFVAYYENRDLNEAIAFLNRAVDTYPASADQKWLVQVNILRSRVLKGMRDREGALRAAEAALSIVSNSGDNKSVLSEALLTTGEILADIAHRDRDVINVLQQFVQNTRKPPGVDVTWSRVSEMFGDAYFNLREYDNAITAYKTALEFNPDHPWILSLYYRIAVNYYQQHAYKSSIQVIHQMLEIAVREDQIVNDYRVYDVLGNAQFALGQYEEAVVAYQTALQLAPPNNEDISKIKSYYSLACERV